MSTSWRSRRSRSSPWAIVKPGGVVGQHHVLVPEGLRRRRHLLDLGAAVAPRRVEVAVAAQCIPVSLAARRDRHVRRGFELGQVVGHLTGQRLDDHLGAGVPDPVELGQRAGGRPLGDLLRVGGPHDVAGPLERLGPEPRVVGPVQVVHHAVERFLRRHRGQGTPASRRSVVVTSARRWRAPTRSTYGGEVDAPRWHLAEFNVARLHQPLDHPDTAEFVAALDSINALAEASPGFVWRLTDEGGQSSSYVVVYDDPLQIINLSVWESVDDLHHFVFRTAHTEFLRRRRTWFERMDEAFLVCWWIPVGTIPSTEEAVERLGPAAPGRRQRRGVHAARRAAHPGRRRPSLARSRRRTGCRSSRLSGRSVPRSPDETIRAQMDAARRAHRRMIAEKIRRRHPLETSTP